MPADPSRNPPTRRTNRKFTSEEEIDSKRARGEISCAECRRLKLKCDKKLPCGSCVRRGCPSICPNGSLSTGQGTRFVLTDTSQLHSEIAEMGQRIRQLEDALAIFQSGVSNDCHPLLREELLSIKFGPKKGYIQQKKEVIKKELVEPPIDAIGTMTIGDRGEAKYFGPSAGSETLFMAGADLERSSSEDDVCATISLEIAPLSASFPFGADDSANKPLDTLVEHLPPELRAWSLCETYMEQATWAFRPIKREELIDDMLSPIYKGVKEIKAGLCPSQPISAHKLAALFLVFAMGALVDMTLEPYNKEADHYYHLGRACLSLRSVFDSPEIATVQAVALMASYHGNAGRRYTMDSSWTLISLSAKLAQSLGLHRDSSRWHMDSKTVQRRRSLFWELFSTEHFYSLALGRPPSIRLSYVDCEFPNDDEATLDSNGNTLVGLDYRWKYEFTKEIFASVVELTLTAEAPQYQTILDLDRKVREKTFFPHLNAFISPEAEEYTPSVYMKRCSLGQYRSITLLYLHRSFFAQSILDHPVNPLQSPYAPSFLATYRCASGVVKSSLNHYDRFPELCGRWWGIWTHLFSAAIIVGCIVTRSPSSSMASSAFIELGLACDLFEKGAMHSRRARSGLAILYKMREKAFQVYSQFRSGNTISNRILSIGKPDYGDDELALFGGQTRVLVSKLLSSSNKVKKQSQPSVSSLSSEVDHRSESTRDVHPSLVEYLSIFPPSNIPARSSGDDAVFPDQHMWVPPLFTPLPSDTYNIISNEFSFPTSRESMASLSENKINQSENSLIDLGMMMTGESGMDEQWMSFMRESGWMSME